MIKSLPLYKSDLIVRAGLLSLVLPLLGYKIEPVTSLTLVYAHPRGTRIGINNSGIWWNHG